MGNNPEKSKKESRQNRNENKDESEKAIPAIRHVGPTLESDPKYLEMEATGGQTPEELIAKGVGVDDSNVRDIISRGTEVESRRRKEPALKPGEPLKTRLPGDTSSDPHTDVGSDNAASIEQEPDIGRDAA